MAAGPSGPRGSTPSCSGAAAASYSGRTAATRRARSPRQPGHRGLEPRRRRGRRPAPSRRGRAALSGEPLPGGSRPGGRCASARRRDRRRGRGRPLRALCPPGARARRLQLGLRLAAFSLRDPPAAIAAARPDAVLACRPHGREVAALPRPGRSPPGWAPGRGVARPGRLSELLGGDPEGFIAPVQWHPGSAPRGLGPARRRCWPTPRRPATTAARLRRRPGPAMALVATRCLGLRPRDPLWAAR